MNITQTNCFTPLLILLSCYGALQPVLAAKILAVTMPQGKSHFMSMLPLLQKLAAEGHDVSGYYEIYKPEPKYPMVENRLLLLDSVAHSDHTEDPVFIDILWNHEFNQIAVLIPYLDSVKSFATAVANHSEAFNQVLDDKWDLIIVDAFFATSGVAMAQKLSRDRGTSCAILSTSMIDPITAFTKSLGWSPITQPPFMFQSNHVKWDPQQFYDRLYGVWDALLLNSLHYLVIQPIMWWHMRTIDVAFDWAKYQRDCHVSLYDYPDRLQWAMPIDGEFHSLGVSCDTVASRQSKLPTELTAFVEDPTSNGTIVVAFGTIVRWRYAPQDKREGFIETLRRLATLDYRVVWSTDSVQKAPLPKNIYVSKWIPQIALLNHPKTLLFINHGGLKSFKETLCSETPAVFVPMFAEQLRNGFLGNSLGFAEVADKRRVIDASYLLEMTVKVIRDDSYRRNVQRAKAIWMDRLLPRLDEAAFYVNRQLRWWPNMPAYAFKHVNYLAFWQHWYLDWALCSLAVITFMRD